MCGCLSRTPTVDLARNPGMCPDWAWNQGPLGSQASTQSIEAQQPGCKQSSELKKSRGGLKSKRSKIILGTQMPHFIEGKLVPRQFINLVIKLETVLLFATFQVYGLSFLPLFLSFFF